MLRKVRILLQKALGFQWKSIPKPDENHVDFFYTFYFMLQMYFLMLVSTDSVWGASGVLQTRKTTKIHVEFLPIHYNRDSNTNDHPVAFIIAASLSASWSHCTQIDLQPKVFYGFQRHWYHVMTSSASRLPYEIVRWNVIQTSLIALPRERKICTEWNESE